MKSMSLAFGASIVLALCTAELAHARPAPLSTAFTYQGQLKQSGNPVSNTADFQFTLWDALSGPTQVAGPVPANNIAIANGLFTTQIDFGATVFDGNARWLEIAVRSPAGGGSFTTLAPRQPLTVAPYALQTRGIFVDSAGKVGIGTTAPGKRLGVSGGLGVFDGAGQGIALDTDTFNIASASTEDLAYQYLYPEDKHVFSTAGTERLIIDSAGNVGIGTSGPTTNFQVGDDLFVDSTQSFVGVNRSNRIGLEYFGVRAPAGDGAYGGMFISTDGNGGWPFYGYSAGGNADMWTYYDGQTDKWHLYNNGVKFTVDGSGNVGIGTSSPTYPLHVLNPTTQGVANGGYFEINAISGFGVLGWARSQDGYSTGVWGQSDGDHGTGVYGYATSSTGYNNIGVVGGSNSPNGYDFFALGTGIDYGTNSSIRWKRNIQPINDPLGMIDAMRGVFFDWDEAHGGRHAVGMIGEEVGKVLPEIVAYEPDGQYVTGMDYSKLTPLLVEAVKALRAEKDAQLDAQQQQMDSLKSENAELRKQLKTLENQVRLLAEQQQRGGK